MKTLLIIISTLMIFGLEAIDLETCLNAVKNKEINIRNSADDYKIAKLKLIKSYFNYLPDASVGSDYTNYYDEMRKSITGLKATVTYPILDGKEYTVLTALNNKKISGLDYQNTEQDVIWNSISLYLSIIASELTVDYYKNSVSIYQTELELIEEMIKLGKRSVLDRFSVEIELNKKQILLLQAETALMERKLEMEDITGLSLIEEEFTFPELNTEEVNSINTVDFQNNRQLKINKYELRNSFYAKLLNLRRLLPDVVLTGNYYKMNTSDWTNSDKEYFYDGFTNENKDYVEDWDITLSLSLSFDIITNRLIDYTVASKQYQKQKRNNEFYEDTLEIELKKAVLNIATLEKKKNMTASNLELSGRNFELSQEKYRMGLISFNDYSESMNDELQAKLDSIQSRNDYFLAVLTLKIITGDDIYQLVIK